MHLPLQPRSPGFDTAFNSSGISAPAATATRQASTRHSTAAVSSFYSCASTRRSTATMSFLRSQSFGKTFNGHNVFPCSCQVSTRRPRPTTPFCLASTRRPAATMSSLQSPGFDKTCNGNTALTPVVYPPQALQRQQYLPSGHPVRADTQARVLDKNSHQQRRFHPALDDTGRQKSNNDEVARVSKSIVRLERACEVSARLQNQIQNHKRHICHASDHAEVLYACGSACDNEVEVDPCYKSPYTPDI